ncbi:hypothetical protein BS50DRAFT_671357 [Corynespora cassiicola Philippines]|uniref:F-box domain-containing protein n=1 Tax=Corynespora cassiicola Philippines TaxID=1448308 RepID=A0A2T2PBV3_CORCC|nr:hypothetical protein BS50DRAFT_671357 [Corynespora cassiicola Philippines]
MPLHYYQMFVVAMTELLDLCYDVLIRILEELNPEDLAACAQTSWGFRNFINENNRLYKAHYLKTFDDPRFLDPSVEVDWVAQLQKFIKTRKILQSGSTVHVKREYFKFVASAIDELIKTGSIKDKESRNQRELVEAFEIPQNLDSFLYRSSLYKRAGTESQKAAEDEEDRQMSAKLHCLYGTPSTTIGRRGLSTHPFARSHVYDLRNYTDETRWGPWRNDGSMKVDWEMVECLMIILSYNSSLCCRRATPGFRPPWTEPFDGVIAQRKPLDKPVLPLEPSIPLDMKDPFDISGIWSRIVCFLDYTDLYHFNFGLNSRLPPDEPREPITTEEAIRHILMRLIVSRIEPPGQFDNPDMPVVHFTGIARAIDTSWDPNANSRIRGTVRMTSEGEVRWTTVSVFYGEEKWSSEGVQVGGRGSKRGVIGTWFDKDHDPHGPAGPTAYWKISNDTSKLGTETDDENENEDEYGDEEEDGVQEAIEEDADEDGLGMVIWS